MQHLQQRAFSVFAFSSGVKMGKIILMCSVFLACFYPGTSEKDLPNGLKGWLMKYSIDGRHFPEQEVSSDVKNAQKSKLSQENMSGLAPRVYYASKLFGLGYRSLNPEIPQVRKYEIESNSINYVKEIAGAGRVERRKVETESNIMSNARESFGKRRFKRGKAPPATTAKPGTTPIPSCSKGWLHCQNTSICIKSEWLCDGVFECPQRWDEWPQNCPNNSLQVTNIQATPLPSGTSVNITWHPKFYQPPDFPLVGYRIYYRAITQHFVHVLDAWHVEDTENANNHVVSHLQPCSEYEFRVQVHLKGFPPGPFSATTKAKTLTVQTTAPKNVQHELKVYNSLQITWDSPALFCHLITNYKVYYRQEAQKDFHIIETGNVQLYHLTGLTGEVTYIIKLQAYNVAGGGEFSAPLYVWMPKLPQQPSAPVYNLHHTFVNDTAVVFTWGVPMSHNGSTVPVLGYKVYQMTSSGLVLLATINYRNYTLSSLHPSSTYSFTVKPYNQAGEGPGAIINVTTLGELPSTQPSKSPLSSTPSQSNQLPSSSTPTQSNKLPRPSHMEIIAHPTKSSQNPTTKHDKPDRPYWAIGVAVACVIHILIAVYLVRKKIWLEQSQRPAFFVFRDEQPTSQEMQPSQGGQSSKTER
ncbi:uncharacterized protein LOC144663929 [Oculina patagonica]